MIRAGIARRMHRLSRIGTAAPTVFVSPITSGLVLQLDSTQSGQSPGVMTGWSDVSGNGNNFGAPWSGSTGPTLLTDSSNGLLAASFSGGQTLRGPSSLAALLSPVSGQESTIYVVARLTSTAALSRLFYAALAADGATPADNFNIRYNNGAPFWAGVAGGSSSGTFTAGSTASPTVTGVSNSGGTSTWQVQAYVTGAQQTIGTAVSQATYDTLTLGAMGAASNTAPTLTGFANARIFAVLQFSGPHHTSAQQTTMYNALKAFYSTL